LGRRPRVLELDQRRHERLGDEAAAEAAEVSARVRECVLHLAPLASATNRHTLSGSLRPGCASTPEFTSTAYGCAVATARATFSGVRPAARMIRHRSFARSRAIVHSIGWRASPSLQRAALSRRSAAASLRYCRNFTLGMNGGMPPMSVDGARSLIVLITGTGKPSRSSGFSSPWNCRAARPHASWTALMWPAGWSQKMPTVVMNGGSARTIGATFSGVMKRGVFSTKMNPSASAPASTAMSASSRLVMPQIFTRGIIEWVGRDAPPISPPARVVTGHYVLLAPRCAPGGATLRSRVLLAWRPSAVHQCQFADLRG